MSSAAEQIQSWTGQLPVLNFNRYAQNNFLTVLLAYLDTHQAGTGQLAPRRKSPHIKLTPHLLHNSPHLEMNSPQSGLYLLYEINRCYQ